MLKLTGEYDHIIDEKNRLFISTKLRSKIDAEKYGPDFVLTLGADGILCLYPEKCFEAVVAEAAARAGASDESIEFERLHFALSSTVEFDRQGRLLINEKLKKRANLGTELTLIGARDHIEIWNTADWEQYLRDHAPRYEKQVSEARQVVFQKQSEHVGIIQESQED